MEHESLIARHRAVAIVGLLVASLLVVSLIAVRSRSDENAVVSGSGAATRVGPATSPTLLMNTATANTMSPAAGVNCDLDAATTYIPQNPQQERLLAGFAPAHAPADKSKPMIRSTAIRVAEESSGRDPAVALTAPSDAVEYSYADLVKESGARVTLDPRINPRRCLWLVTVHGSFIPRGGPGGGNVTPLNVYNVVLDVATGTGLQVIAGPDLSKPTR